MTSKRYTGRIITVHGDYGFIGRNSILGKDDKAPSDFDSERDVYIHKSALSCGLAVGKTVVFSVEPDPVRREGNLRAVDVIEIIEAELVPKDGSPVIPGFMAPAVHKGGALAHPMHERMKAVDADQVAKADENHAFADLKRDATPVERLPNDPEQIRLALCGYLRRLYIHLESHGLSFDILNADETVEDAAINEAVRDLEEMGMSNQALRLRNEYAAYKATRSMLGWLYSQDFFRPGAPISASIIATFVKLAETLRDSSKKAGLTQRLQAATSFMTERNILLANTVLPISNLPDLFLAVPVWYYANGSDAVKAAQDHEDPNVLQVTRFFCNLLPQNERWADLFQMFNRRGRDLSMYVGDTIPTHIVRVIREARTVFTHVVIMTPYHDVAGKDWQDETWLRSIDPYVVGFMEGVPYAFILGRFSDTGIFPLHSELVADTMAYLAANKGSLKNFNSTEHGGVMHLHAYWAGRESHLLGDLLIERVDELLAAFEAGKAFDWLRDEWTASNEVARQ